MVTLTEITLNNFKSFKGEHRVGTVMPVTAVIGANGSGKSNFMDAISFVMGLHSKHLRVTKLNQLIYNSIGGESPNEMSVKSVLQANNGVQIRFERSVVESVCQYRVNDNTVTREVYVENLMKLSLNPRVNAFIVFQDSLETFLHQSPKERVAIFEKISGSESLASEYNRLSASIAQHSREMEHLVQKKKIILSDIRTLKDLHKNGLEYKDLEKDHRVATTRLALFDLFCVERCAAGAIGEFQTVSREISELEKKKTELETNLAIAIQASNEMKPRIEEIEREVAKIEIKAVELLQEKIKFNAAIEYAKRCVDTCRKSYEGAVEADKARERTIAELEEALSLAEKKRQEHCLRYSKTLGGTMELDHSLTKMYEELKKRYLETCAADEAKLASVQRNRQFFEDTLECSTVKMNEAKEAVERQLAFDRSAKERANRLEQHRDAMRRQLENERQLQRELSLNLRAFKEQEDKLVNEIDEIGKVEFDREELREKRKKAHIVANLKERFDGVYDRLGKMCEPIHHRWAIAIKKVLGPHKNSIVVDTTKTAASCIEYLRDERLLVETFLPLDSIAVKSLEKNNRTAIEAMNAKLLYDVIKFSPPDISKAVLYATGNTLVAETTDEASEIAFNAEKRYDCVARKDGILYRRSGLLSGGTSSRSTVGKYKLEEQTALQLHKEGLIAKLREIRRDAPAEQKLIEVTATVQRLETRLKYLEDDLDKSIKESGKIEAAIWELENAFDDAQAQCEKDQESLRSVSTEFEVLKTNIRAKEAEIFAEFCERLGIEDIRQYENGQELYQETLQDLDNQIDRIQRQLEYERSAKSKVGTLKERLDRAEDLLRSANEEMATRTRESGYDELKRRTQQLESTDHILRENSKRVEEEIARSRLQLREVSEMYLRQTRKLERLKSAIQFANEKHRNMVIEAKMNGVNIRVMNDPPSGVSQTLESSDTGSSPMARAEIDYDKLPRALLESDYNDAPKIRNELAARVDELSSAMRNMSKPNVTVYEELMNLVEKKDKTDRAIKETSRRLHEIREDFDEIKHERHARFVNVFDRVQSRVDSIYKSLTGSDTAQVYLVPENPEEPYLDGIHYSCVPPEKRLCNIADLSGGEKALAALSLLFSLQSAESPPCQVLDEIDGPLDNANVKKLAKYVRRIKPNQQTIVVSHKRELISAADQVISIASTRKADGVQSNIFTLNLQRYRKKKKNF